MGWMAARPTSSRGLRRVNRVLTGGSLLAFAFLASLFVWKAQYDGLRVGNPFLFVDWSAGSPGGVAFIGVVFGSILLTSAFAVGCCGRPRQLPPVHREVRLSLDGGIPWRDDALARAARAGFHLVEESEFRCRLRCRSSPPEELHVELLPSDGALLGRVEHRYLMRVIETGETERAAQVVSFVAGEKDAREPAPRVFPWEWFGALAVAASWVAAGLVLAPANWFEDVDLATLFVAIFAGLAVVPVRHAGRLRLLWAAEALAVTAAVLGVLSLEAGFVGRPFGWSSPGALRDGAAVAEREYAEGRSEWRAAGLLFRRADVDAEFGLPIRGTG